MQRVTQVSIGVCSPTLDFGRGRHRSKPEVLHKGAGVHRHLQERHNKDHGGEEGAEKNTNTIEEC